jgi:hypothetical protein
MSDDLLEQLRRENPVPERMAALPIEPVLARLDDEPATACRSQDSRRSTRRLSRVLPVALSVAVVLAVAGVALTLGGHDHPAGSSTNPAAPPPKHVTPRRVNPARIARENAHDTPLQLFESPSLNSMGPGTSAGPGAPIKPYPETVIPSTVRELGTFSLAGVGTVQYWTADTRQHGVCGGLRLPDGVWVQLQKNPGDGSMPGCWPTRAQTGQGALIIDGFDYITSGVIGRQGQRWMLAYGAVSVPETVTRVRDTDSGIDAAIVSDNHFVIALHPTGNDWGDIVHLEAFDTAGRRIATQGKALPGTPTGNASAGMTSGGNLSPARIASRSLGNAGAT